MQTADSVLNKLRPLAAMLVKHKQFETGSKMQAYERVASKVGASSSWLRKLIGRQPNVDVAAHQYLNILSLYRKLCERIEAKAEEERRKLEALMGHADAFLESDLPSSSSAPREAGSREADYSSH